MKIRARKNPSGITVYQLDLGLIDGRRVRQTFQNKADAQSALVRARAKVASEGINALIPPAPEHPNLAKWMLRLEGTGKTLDDVFRWFFETYREPKSVPPTKDLLSTYRQELGRLNRTQKYIHQSLATLNVFPLARPATIPRARVAETGQKRIPIIFKRVEMLYIENHRVYGLDPADPIRVSYGTPLGEELIARERPDLVRMPVDSQSLLPVLLGAPRAEARRELVLQRMGHLALSQGGWRYIPANRPPGTKRSTVAKGAETVLAKTHRYRLAADPGGNHNLPASDREQVAALAEAVAADGMMAK